MATKDMNQKLWKLLRLNAKTEKELKEKYRQVYIEEYVEQKIYNFQGKRVIFAYSQFDHAFSESSDYKTSMGVHDKPFSKKRAKYILWIKKVLSIDSGQVEYSFEHRSEMRTKKGKQVVVRIYAVVEEKYVVVLDQKGDELYFITALPHDKSSYQKMIKRSVCLEYKKVPSSLGD